VTSAYRGLMALAFVVGLGAVAFSGFGLYTVFTDDPSDAAENDVLGEYACAAFEGDPEPAHAADYEIERTLLGTSEIDAFNVTATGTVFRANLTTKGRLLAASARQADGTNVSVRRVSDDRLVIDHDHGGPFRLWIDSIGEESTITRTELDICP
jgi:hypothetical protein